MLSFIWCFLILLSLIFGVVNGNISDVTQSVSVGAKESVTLILSILGIMCFWSGIMEIMIKSKLIDKFSVIFMPILSRIFKNSSNDEEIMKYITSNFTANLLGLSNAATPMGLKAAEKIYNKNGRKTTHDLIMLVIINTASIQLIPTTVSAIRTNYGASNAFDIIPAVWITSVASVLSAIIVAKICEKSGL